MVTEPAVPLHSDKRIAVVIVAAGTGTRAAAGEDRVPKQYRLLGGKPVLARTIGAFLDHPAVDWVQPVIHPDHGAHYAALALADRRLRPPVPGGTERRASVLAGLEALAPLSPDLVLIQDAARPLTAAPVIDGVIEALATHDGAVPALAVTDTIKRSADGRRVAGTEDRRTLFAAQTPQGFRFPQILSAHLRASRLPRPFTDDAEIAEWAGMSVALTAGSARNIKITHPEDFAQAELMLGGQAMETRVGTGFDVHPFAPGDTVWLGGVAIPHTARLAGHSDADAALHALCDAVYGALGAGDIGTHFPPGDARWKDARSSIFLAHAAGLVAARGGRIVNLDLTIVCEAPRIGPHVPAMRAAIAAICGIAEGRIAIKATTAERLGFIGRGEGLTALATASIELPRSA
ncbi:MAG TPA: bifunctional 2-C-methyl-D-erythritol 4-phosphate cytidylyltransferase/2-C-methyl-D-erythritol 2,4-cyclodiphosphate synthase [Alphaproteobacteria bacterium]|nr:bifunctional 2-C-methyl-D-erythritol 4-phosphate cytidylyltransferase/2-C-methyl-D-erythritol 2,4-cyclodiphosphate synthase [Alphaproteobacteria bacterium]